MLIHSDHENPLKNANLHSNGGVQSSLHFMSVSLLSFLSVLSVSLLSLSSVSFLSLLFCPCFCPCPCCPCFCPCCPCCPCPICFNKQGTTIYLCIYILLNSPHKGHKITGSKSKHCDRSPNGQGFLIVC